MERWENEKKNERRKDKRIYKISGLTNTYWCNNCSYNPTNYE